MEVDDRGFWRVTRDGQRQPTLASRFLNTIWQYLVTEITYTRYLMQSMIEVLFTLPFQIWQDVFGGAREPFNHQPLAKGHIRLLRLERWLPFRRVRVSLMVVHILDVPVYQAISYTWGSNKKTHEILIDGHTFKTTASTYGALHACSSVLGPTTVWIDYVCIDQDNLQEKNVQVGMMNRIYQKATWVSVWLGGCANRFTAGMTIGLINDLAKLMDRPPNSDITQTLTMLAGTWRWRCLVTLLNLPWFTRVWVIQEVVVAPEVQFIYGGMRFMMETLVAGLNIFLDPQAAALLGLTTTEGTKAYTSHVRLDMMAALQRNRQPESGYENLMATLQRNRQPEALFENLMAAFQRNTQPEPGYENLFTLPVLLANFANSESTDPRDKIFALSGMTTDPPNEAFKPDYTKTVREVYVNVAKYLLSSENPFSAFAYAGIGRELVSRDWELPSWVPDWESPLTACALNLPIRDNFSSDGFRCSGNSSARISFGHNPDVLIMAGILVDEVKSLSRPFDTRLDNGDCFVEQEEKKVHQLQTCNAIYGLHQEALMLALNGGRQLYRTNTQLIHAFWRTLVADRTPMCRPAPVALASDYGNWVEAIEYEHLHMSNGEPSTADLKRHFQSLSDFGSALGPCAVGRRFCVTEKGYFGMLPPKAEIGDKICVFLGARTPFVLRKEGERFKLVGESYVHQIMDGEMMKLGSSVENIQLQ